MSQENSALVAIGTILDGKFRVTQEIGHGGMATVYEAENVDIGKRVAIKVLSAELANSSVVTERFMREARAAAKIRSPHICDVYDVGTYSGRPFLVMELLEGESLYERLSRDRRLPIDQTLRIATETALGLAQAHEANIVHRDLKPENIFLSRTGGGEEVTKIVDFGLAKFYEPNLEGGEAARLTKAGALFGTPAYMSPEQASAQGPVGHRSDLWALGCIVYEMLVGRTVWNVDQGVAMILAQIAGGPLPTPSRVRSDLPKSFDRWFLQALSRDSEGRFADARQMAEALAAALRISGEQVPASGPGSEPQDNSDRESTQPALKPLVRPPPTSQRTAERPGTTSPSQLPTSLPAPLRHHRGRWIAAGLTLVAACVLGLVARSGIKNPNKLWRTLSFRSTEKPVERQPFALRLAVGQEQLADGMFVDAIASFEKAFADGENKAARSIRSHAQAVDEATSQGPCRLSGLGHPRPFDASGRASRPTLAWNGESLLFAWATSTSDNVRPIEMTRLDFALRRVAPASLLTVDTADTRDPQLFRNPSGLALLYSLAEGKSSTVYTRQLDAVGTPLGPAHAITLSDDHYAYDPHLVVGDLMLDENTEPTHPLAPSKNPPLGHWIVFTRTTHRRAHDLFVRRLDSMLKPVEDPVAITALSIPKKRRHIAAQATIAIGHDVLSVAYREQTESGSRVLLQSINPRSEHFRAPGVSRPAEEEETDSDLGTDRFLGKVTELSDSADSQTSPRVACGPEGCFTAWSDETTGAHLAFSEPATGELIWTENFADQGVRPAVAHSDGGALLTWYEDSRLMVAPVSHEGLGEASVVARVSGLQPPTEIVPGDTEGQWYIAWRTFEAATLEPFAAQVHCRSRP